MCDPEIFLSLLSFSSRILPFVREFSLLTVEQASALRLELEAVEARQRKKIGRKLIGKFHRFIEVKYVHDRDEGKINISFRPSHY